MRRTFRTSRRPALAAAAVALALVGTCGVAGAFAQPRWGVSVEGRVATDTVDISLVDKGIEPGATAVDGSSVPHGVEVVNCGVPCWVRLKTELVGADGRPVAATVLDPSVSDVVLGQDGYAYLARPLEENERWSWEEDVGRAAVFLSGKEGEVRVVNTVEAVQRDHVAPDFAADDPWGGIPVEKGLVSRTETRGGDRG